jgi:peptidase M50B-like protein
VRDDPWVVALSAALAVSAVAVPRFWRWTRHVSTIVHEAGHAIVALLTGRRLAGIRLHSDSSGVTVSVGRPRGPGMVAMLAAGYPAPAFLGLGAAALLRADRADVLLWGLVVVLAGLALQIRNWFGAWTILATGAVVFAVTWWLPPGWHRAFAYLVTWFLCSPDRVRSSACTPRAAAVVVVGALAAPTRTSWRASRICRPASGRPSSCSSAWAPPVPERSPWCRGSQEAASISSPRRR